MITHLFNCSESSSHFNHFNQLLFYPLLSTPFFFFFFFFFFFLLLPNLRLSRPRPSKLVFPTSIPFFFNQFANNTRSPPPPPPTQRERAEGIFKNSFLSYAPTRLYLFSTFSPSLFFFPFHMEFKRAYCN
jgi:hypothetical protein